MDLQARYAAALRQKGFAADPAQSAAVARLEQLGHELSRRTRPGGIVRRWRALRGRPGDPPVRGVYLWGDVGRGKTFLMDLFFDALPFPDRLRYHFHRLMYRVHNRLRTLRSQTDPIEVVAREISEQARIICFDEFFVSDITDAMILGNLLEALFQRGVTLVATSNIPPDQLYAGGLQRQQFLPAIGFIREHTDVLHLAGSTDYRLRILEQAEIYHSPLDTSADRNLATWFAQIAPDEGRRDRTIEVNGRDIELRQRADGIAWFNFRMLCDGPRSQNDYIEIARAFQTVILSGVPVLDETMENQARRLVALVDEFYDHRVKLIISAAAPVDSLYRGSRLAREFARTRSRLVEMQSKSYLAAPHVP
jgi:cell division protein ZapE